MPQKISPFGEVKFGWDLGESNWNGGMDENLVKFSFLFDKNVDDISDTLPASPLNGTAYFNTTDNRLYFRVNNLWYSSPMAKWGILNMKSTGQSYQFDGTTLVALDSSESLANRVDAIEADLVTLGSAAYQDTSSFATPAELDISEANSQAYTDGAITNLQSTFSSSTGASMVGRGVETVDSSLSALESAVQPLSVNGVIQELAKNSSTSSFIHNRHQAYRLTSKAALDSFYDHFGVLDLLPTGELILLFRRGSEHTGGSDGVIAFRKMLPDGTWGPVSTVAEQAGLDFRAAGGGVMPSGRIVVSGTIWTTGDLYVYISDDYGDTWQLQHLLPKGSTDYRLSYGRAIQVEDKFVLPYYTKVGADNQLRWLETVDGGETWVEGATIYSGPVEYNEAEYVSCGNGVVVGVTRIGSGTGGKLRQFLSTNGGSTWTNQGDVTAQNGDATDVVVSPSLSYYVSDSGTPHIILFYTNRTTSNCFYRTIPVSKAVAGVSGWSDRVSVYSAPADSGYQSQLVLGNRVIGNLYRELSATQAGAYQFEAYLGNLPDYDSGWTEVAASTQYTLTHGLQKPPTKVDVEFATSINPTTWWKVYPSHFNDGAPKGSGAQVAITAASIVVGTGAAVFGTQYFGGLDPTRQTSGFYRVRAWL